MSFTSPLFLFLLPIALLPLMLERHHSRAYSWLDLIPRDPLSDIVGMLLKVLAVIALLFIILELAQAVRIPPVSTFPSVLPEIRFAIPEFQLSALYSPFTIIHPFFAFPYALFPLPQLPAVQFPLSSFQISVIAIFTLVLGLIGNAILLRERSEVRK